MLRQGNYIDLGIYCAKHYKKEIEPECNEARIKSAEEINQYLLKKQDIPFGRVVVETEKYNKIKNLLMLDVALGIKYRALWDEFTDQYQESNESR